MTRHVWIVCKNEVCRMVFEVDGSGPAVCPDCGSPHERESPPNYLALRAKLYGTDAVPKWNLGLGAYTSGKSDYKRKYESKQLVPYDG